MGKGKGRNGDQAHYSEGQLAEIDRLEADLAVQLAAKPKRLAHSLSVSRECERLALIYDVEPYPARVAGILHDWDKALDNDELVAMARERGVDLGVPLERVKPLLHGIVAAIDLPARYPELPGEVFRAISRHTTGAADPSPLDMVLFVADGIEPLRPDTPGIRATRELVGKVTLEDLYYESFVGGLVYVLEGGRYLYPGALDIYNELAQERREKKG